MITVIVVQAVAVFNDFTGPLYFLPGNENATVQLTLYNFQSRALNQYNLLFMDILLITIPPLHRLRLLQPADRGGHDLGCGEGLRASTVRRHRHDADREQQIAEVPHLAGRDDDAVSTDRTAA